MKKLALLLLVLGTLGGCVAYPVPYGGGGYHHRQHGGAYYGQGDRDGDGVQDRNDRRPNNPRRY